MSRSSPALTARSSLRMRSFSLLEALDFARLFRREYRLAAARLRGLQLGECFLGLVELGFELLFRGAESRIGIAAQRHSRDRRDASRRRGRGC